MTSFLIFFAIFIVVALLAIAVYMHWLLHRQKIEREQQVLSMQKQEQEARERHEQSIRFIARAYAAGQVESPEACLRLAGLLDILRVDGEAREPYIAIDKMRDAIAHIPIKDEWLALTKPQRRLYAMQLEEQTLTYQDFIDPAIKKLEAFSVAGVTH